MHAGGLRAGTALVLKYVRDEVSIPTSFADTCNYALCTSSQRYGLELQSEAI